MARAIKHIKAGLLNFEIIGTVPEASPVRQRRSGRCCATCAAQQFYNDKCSWRELELKLAANYRSRDYVVTGTYDNAHLPRNKAETKKCCYKYLRRLRDVRRKRGQDLRYVYVAEGWHGKADDEYFGGDGRLEDKRFHNHMVINGCGPGDLEEIRSLWPYGGYVRIEPVDVHYYRELAKYLTKEAREFGRAKPGEKVWSPSRNLIKYEVEYIDIPSDSVTLSAPPGAVDYVQFSERNPYGFADCIGARYLLFPDEASPGYSYTKGRKPKKLNNFLP